MSMKSLNISEGRLDHLEERSRTLTNAEDLLETAWGVIANSYGGDWSLASPEWHEAAIRWRDKYHDNFSPHGDDDEAQGYLPVG